MLTKITFHKILFMAVLLLIIPMIMSAAGNYEAGNGEGITLAENVQEILDKLDDDEDYTLEDGKVDFLNIEKEYQVSENQKELIFGMMEQVKLGVLKPEECEKELQEQLQQRKREQITIQTQDGTAVGTQTKAVVQTQTRAEKSK